MLPAFFEKLEHISVKFEYMQGPRKNRRRFRRHGFLKRMSTRFGRAVIKRRRQKGRKKLSV